MPQYWIGSSSVTRLASQGKGNTGPTGPTGNIGPIGITGPTGNVGPYLIGMSLIGGVLWNNFSNGASAAATGTPKGKTGSAVFVIDAANIGVKGISLIDFVDTSGSVPTINIRPIKFDGHNVNKTNSTKAVVTPNLVAPTSLTVSGSSSNQSQNIVKFLNVSGTLVGITKTYANSFVIGNIIDPLIPYPHSSSTEYSQYILTDGTLASATGMGITLIIEPLTAPNKGRLKDIILDLKNGSVSGNLKFLNLIPPTIAQNHSLNVYLQNCVSPSSPAGKLTINSPTVLWAANTSPCTNITSGGTCDVLLNFYFVNGNVLGSYKYIKSNYFCNGSGYQVNSCTRLSLNGEGGAGGRIGKEEINEETINSVNWLETGACCYSDGTCQETTIQNCSGFFHGSGTTCGSTADFICSKKGACCVNNGLSTTCFDELTCTECLDLNNIPGVISKFTGSHLKCENIDCTLDVFVGACCDGEGNCASATQANCINYGGFYHGNFSRCVDKYGKNICSGSTGACCIDGSCSEVSFDVCKNSYGIFAGYNKTCANIQCNLENICSPKNSKGILPGDEYGGGVVVGKFIPGKSTILGCSELFSKSNYNFINNLKFNCNLFTSQKEPNVGIAEESCFEDDLGYLIIVYPYDIVSDKTETIKNPFEEPYTIFDYHWGLNGYVSWGPLMKWEVVDDIQYNGNNYYNTVSIYGEGYWSKGLTGTTLATNAEFIRNSFPSCFDVLQYGTNPENKFFGKSSYGLHGTWFHSYGLYNTIRAISAMKANSYGLTGYNPINPNIFYMVQKLDSGLTSASQGITQSSAALSDWFVPSHDEFAFLAEKTLNDSVFNINTALIEKGYQPIIGKYWTSTGTFDYNTTIQGIYNGNSTPVPGNVAISYYISDLGLPETYEVEKTNRQQRNKLRPIRIIRCDEKYPSSSKIWNLPKI